MYCYTCLFQKGAWEEGMMSLPVWSHVLSRGDGIWCHFLSGSTLFPGEGYRCHFLFGSMLFPGKGYDVTSCLVPCSFQWRGYDVTSCLVLCSFQVKGLWCHFLSGSMFFHRGGGHDVLSCLVPCSFQGGYDVLSFVVAHQSSFSHKWQTRQCCRYLPLCKYYLPNYDVYGGNVFTDPQGLWVFVSIQGGCGVSVQGAVGSLYGGGRDVSVQGFVGFLSSGGVWGLCSGGVVSVQGDPPVR